MRCLDGDSAHVVVSSEVELEPGVKMEFVSKFCYLGDTLGSAGGVVVMGLRLWRFSTAFSHSFPNFWTQGHSHENQEYLSSMCLAIDA